MPVSDAPRRTRDDHGDRRTLLALAGVAVVSLLLRTVGLGKRVFHWDEGRVGYWILRYHETGQYHYRPIVHGPFIQHVDSALFHVLAPTDFAARLPVAVITAALPLSVWLLRAHLRETELVALGAILSLDPLLLYYSRFVRSDPLVGAFAFFTFALLVRAWDTRDVRFGYAAAATMALAFASKENALVYALCFVGAAALVYDHRLLRAVHRGESVRERLGTDRRAVVRAADRLSGDASPWWWAAGNLAGMALCFLAVFAFMYAPRPDLWQAFAHPSQFPGVLREATLGTVEKFESVWLGGGFHDHDYVPFLADLVETLAFGSAVTLVLAAMGFLADGYTGENRPLVSYATYWGAVSVLGYAAATDIKAPWAGFHVVLPLAIPAAIGVGYVVAVGRTALRREDAAGAVVAALVLLTAVGGVAGANAAYWNASTIEHKQVLQWAQPNNDLKPTLERVDAVARNNEGTDVLFYGTHAGGRTSGGTKFYVDNESSALQPPPGGPAWHSRLPLPWYLERAGANVTSTAPDAPPDEALADAPPVVIAFSWDAETVGAHLDGYARSRHDFKLWGEEIVVFVDRDAMRDAGVDPGDDTSE